MELAMDPGRPDSWKSTCDEIARLRERTDGRMSIGAGTVLTREAVQAAADAGAQFIVSPNTDARVISAAKERGLVSIPGAMTPSEIVSAYGAGANFVKVFPAGCLGADYVKAVRAPLEHIPMLAVAGIDLSNAAGFIKAGCVGLGIGKLLADPELVARGAFDELQMRAEKMVQIIASARNSKEDQR